MALTFLRAAVGSGGTKYQVTANTTGAASVLVAMPGTGTSTANITSSRGNVATYLGRSDGFGAAGRVAIYFCNNVTNPGTSDTFTNPDGNVSAAEAHVICYSDGAGLAIVGSVQVGEDATFSGTTTAGGGGQTPLAAFASTQAGDSIIGAVGFISSTPSGIGITPGTGSSIDSLPANTVFNGCTFHHDASSTGSVQPVVSWTGSTRWVAMGALMRGAALPVLTLPTATVAGTTTATVGATVPIATGTLRAVITSSATVPGTAQVIAGQDHTGSTSGVLSGSLVITSTGAKTFDIAGLTSGTTRHVYLALEDTGGNSAVVYAGAIYPGTWRVASDVTATGWVLTGAATHAAALNEDTANDSTYTTSPALSSTASSLTMALDEARPAGTYTERIRVNVSSGTGFCRMVALNDAGTVQGQTADQAITSTLTTYSLPLTQTGTATRLRLDVWI